MAMGPKQLSYAVSKVTKKSCSKKFVSLGRILNHWEQIVGEEMSKHAQPTKIQYRKPKNRREKPSATLEIAVPSAQATLMHYQIDLILERINSIYGERWITAIRFVHIPANMSKRPSFRNQQPKMNGQEKQKLNGMLENISDPEMRLRLESLGQAMLLDKHRI
tara:strand:+ start:419966 stop:420454 length:489 start_codon:yes stop_codon:yes gene_type:complete